MRAAAAVLLVVVAFVAYASWGRGERDVIAYWEAGARMRAGASPYDAPALTGRRFLYPPAAAAAFAPLTFLAPAWGLALWMALHLVWLALLLRSVAALYGLDDARRLHVVVLAVLLVPIVGDLQEGQVNLLVAVLIAAGLVRVEASRPATGAALIAAAAHIKAFPAILLAAFVAQRRVAAAAWLAGWLVVGVLAPWPWLAAAHGPLEGAARVITLHVAWMQQVLAPALVDQRIAGVEEFFSSNYSVLGVLHRLFADVVVHAGDGTRGPLLWAMPRGLVRAVAHGVGVAMLAIGIAACVRGAKRPVDRVIAAALVVVAAQIASVTYWEHHVVLLALLLGAWTVAEDHVVWWLGAGVLVVTLTLPFVWELGRAALGWGDAGVLRGARDFGAPLLGVVLVWVAAARTVWRGAR